MPDTRDTIAAIATPPGRGGIGILRLSGPDALTIAAPLLSLRAPLEPNQARFCRILDPSTDPPSILDQAVATYYAAPRSYTGEHVLEIAAHGSPVLLDFLLRQLTARGARLANPGEFTERAFLNHRLDLTEAEAVRDLIDAQTLYQARVAAAQLGGALSRRVAPVKTALIALIAQLEAGIDFAEDDTPTLSTAALLALAQPIADQLATLARSFDHGRLVHSGLTLAIVGEPNVGKSSLFNRLVERERAIVTDTPGTTRDLVTEHISLAGIPVELIDTAGLREAAADQAERIGIERTREALADADLVLLVLNAIEAPDAANTPSLVHPEPAALATALPAALAAALGSLHPQRTILVLNKCDLLNCDPTNTLPDALPDTLPNTLPGTLPNTLPNTIPDTPPSTNRHMASPHKGFRHLPQDELQIPAAAAPSPSAVPPAAALSAHPPIQTSATTGEGLPELREAIARHLGTPACEDQAGLITNLRQHAAVTAAGAALTAALHAAGAATPHEMLLLDLYAALTHLDSLTGITTPDDILQTIFSTFCIGK